MAGVDGILHPAAGSVQKHTTCVTEEAKYVYSATKPGGAAADGFHGRDTGKQSGQSEVSGREFLSTRPPWKCSLCNTGCTSQETLLSHAAGAKHSRRVRAASAAASGERGDDAADAAEVAVAPASGATRSDSASGPANGKAVAQRASDVGPGCEPAAVRSIADAPEASGNMTSAAAGAPAMPPEYDCARVGAGQGGQVQRPWRLDAALQWS